MIDTAQSLGSAYHVVIEKVYLCSGLDGYVPKFDPSVNEFGCLADSENLLYRFKVLVCIYGFLQHVKLILIFIYSFQYIYAGLQSSLTKCS